MIKSNPPPAIDSTALAARWSPAQIERAAKVSNDISEGIDCRESRAVLRECLSIWVDMATDARTELQTLKDRNALDELDRKMEALTSATADVSEAANGKKS